MRQELHSRSLEQCGIVLDTLVAISWSFAGDPTEDTPYRRHVLNELIVRDAVVGEVWAFEIANNIFVSRSRRGRINEQLVYEYLNLLKALPIRFDSQSLWTRVELESFCPALGSGRLRCSVSGIGLREENPACDFR
jgi:hypothetical protein